MTVPSFAQEQEKERRWYLLPIVAWALMCLPSFLVLPAGDDWNTFSPLHTLSWEMLRPHILWRPFEPVLRRLMGMCGSWIFPVGPHALVIAGHALTGWFVYRILRATSVRAAATAIATAIVLVLPGAGAAVWSVDSAVQTWSTACGLWSVLLLLRGGHRRWPVLWLFPALLALLCKESGLGWSLAAPCLAALLSSRKATSSWRRTGQPVLLGLGMIGIYLLVRLTLADGNPDFYGEGRYTLSPSPSTLISNLGLLLGAAILPVDTLALLGHPRSVALAGITAAMGIPFIVLATRIWVRTQTAAQTLLAAASVVLVAGPHLLIPHVSEMYAHPIIVTVALLVVPVFGGILLGNRQLKAMVFCLVLASGVSDTHKLAVMVRSGREGQLVGRRIASRCPKPVRWVCAIPAVNGGAGYSVFQLPPGPASGWGKAVLHEWGWPREVRYSRQASEKDCRALPADLVVNFTASESFDLWAR